MGHLATLPQLYYLLKRFRVDLGAPKNSRHLATLPQLPCPIFRTSLGALKIGHLATQPQLHYTPKILGASWSPGSLDTNNTTLIILPIYNIFKIGLDTSDSTSIILHT